MINRTAFLTDLQALLKRLEADLLERSEAAEVPNVRQTLRAEYERARNNERTATNYEDWRSDAITQAAAAWLLSCVFVRFLEDNQLINPPKISGPKERLQRARDEHEFYFSKHRGETDRDYLLAVFDELAAFPVTKDVFGEHSPIRELPSWLSGDAATDILRFFQKINANTGDLIHDLTDHQWDTRFLGDLYQELSEAAQEKYALLQTPEFVEEFILDRTLEPAIKEFGLDASPIEQHYLQPATPGGFRLIDPACGSGHFLLGGFRRLFEHWSRREPDANSRVLAQRALDCVFGVDINPYAVAISRFRLLLAAMHCSEIKSLADSPHFEVKVACGDSLLHGPDTAIQSKFRNFKEEDHAYWAEDLSLLRQVLRNGYYHAVVANPPYITPKDRGLKKRYRNKYQSCHMQYSLAVPFMERIFRLAISATDKNASGFTGQITANNYMKREFGKKLIEGFLPNVDLTHVIDTSGAYIPGHGTPTVILFGRNRKPVADTIRTVMGIRGEPSTPADPSKGLVWSAIVEQTDQPGSQGEFVSVSDSQRALFHKHPWSIGGGGAAELRELLETTACMILNDSVVAIGRGAHTGEDDAYVMPYSTIARRLVPPEQTARFVTGDTVRDWTVGENAYAIFPYDEHLCPTGKEPHPIIARWLWPFREQLWRRVEGNGTHRTIGLTWFEYSRFHPERFVGTTLAYAEIATHNHFVLDRGGKVFNRTAPVIKLRAEATADDHLALLGLLNSSIACFWLKQGAHNKGDSTDNKGARTTGDSAFNTFAYNATLLGKLPLPKDRPIELAHHLHYLAQELDANSPRAAITLWDVQENLDPVHKRSLQQVLDDAYARCILIRGEMILSQEDLDWQCYRLYGLIDEDVIVGIQPRDERWSILPGMRAFEVLLAQDLSDGKTQTKWFERHGITPRAELADIDLNPQYRQIVERRIGIIRKNREIALIEQPEYKRRWYEDIWGNRREEALREWLLNRLESYFDFDGRMNHEGQPTSELDIALTTITALTDVAARDLQFMEVGEVYRNDRAFDVQRLVEELVQAESVPLLPVLCYKPSGLRKRSEWGKTWILQRQEDVLDARARLPNDDPQYLTEDQARHLKRQEIGDIPVPPKFTSADFLSSGGARYWALRGKLDVPKERWISFPHCEGPDGTLVIAWAGYDHLQLARAISAYYVEIQEHLGGRDDPRLVPLLACIIELLPWLRQWHNDIDPDFDQRMDEFFEGFVAEEAKALNLTIDEVRKWQPPQRANRRGGRTAS